jgi:hypothetical protein
MPKPWIISFLRTAILLSAFAGIDLAAHAQTPPCGQPGLGSCFQPSGTPGCNDVACCEAVCSFDPFCCQLAWDGACAALAQGLCVPCLQCVSGSIPEGEPCGANTLNPGCDVPNGPLSILAPGDLICGQLWADSGQRDSDWYAFQVDDPDGDGQAELGISFGAGAPASLTMFDGACGSLTQVWETTADCLGGLSHVFCVPAPRTYRLRVTLVDSVGYECTSPIQPEYLLEAIIGSHTGCATLCCPVECPPGAILEGESCGSDANGGCNSIPPAFESIGTAGVEICGTAWADGDIRDTDWFELSLATPCTVTIRVEAAFPPLAVIVDGNGQCSGAAILSSNSGPECSTVVTHAVLPAGNWWLVVLPDTFNGYPCGSGKNSYVASIDCLPLPTTDCDGNGSQDVSGLDPFCCTCICAGDPFCCGVLWDATCVDAADAACERDCNANGSLDTLDVLVAASVDCNGNCVPDECEARCDANCTATACSSDPDCCWCLAQIDPFCCTVWDALCSDLAAQICDQDCNCNGIPDSTDVRSGASSDCNANCIPDECEQISVAVAPTSASATLAALCAGQTTILTATGGSGTALEWFAGSCGGTLVGTGNNLAVTPGVTTTYFVRWTGVCGASGCVSTTVTVTPAPVAPTSASAAQSSICIGQSTTLTVSGGSGATLQWFTGSCGGTLVGTGNNLIVSPSNATTYFARWVNGSCVSACVSVTVSVSLAPPQTPVNVSAVPAFICIGQQSLLSASTTSPPVIWRSGACNGPVVGTGSVIAVQPTVTTTYFASASNACGTSPCASVTVTVSTAPPPIPTQVTATPPMICSGQSSVLSATTTPGSTLTWRSGSCNGPVIGTGPSIVVSPNPFGGGVVNYFVSASNACGTSGCAGVSVTVQIASPPTPTAATAIPSAVCSGQSSALSATTVPGATLTWRVGACNGPVVPGGASPTVTPTSTTTYFASATNACGTSNCASVTVSVSPLPVAPSAATATPPTICAGQSTSLKASGGSGGTLEWFTGSCGGTLVGTGNNLIVTPTGTTTYFARWTTPTCGSSACASVVVIVEPLPVAPTIAAANPPTICVGSSTQLTATGGSGTTLQWFTGSCGGTLVGTGNNLSVSPTADTTYFVRWTTPNCGSSTCASVLVTVVPPPSAPTSATVNPTTFCQGQVANITLTAVGGSGGTLQWFAGSCGGTPVGTGASLVLPAPAATTTYFVRSFDPICGGSTCVSTTVTVTPPGPCGCGNPPTQTIWYPDHDGDGCGDPAGPTITQCANLPAPMAVSTCPGVVGTFAYVTNNDDTCDCVVGGCAQTNCNFVRAGLRSRLYTITGLPNGTDWAWVIVSPDFTGGEFILECCLNGVDPPGTTFDLAKAFADSINARGAALGCSSTTQLSAVAIPATTPPNTAYLTVRVGDATGTPLNPSWLLGVGPCGGPVPPSSWCFAQTFSTPPATTCTFNPTMIEVPASGKDCNGNEVDDAFDIELGTSLDQDGDGVPDECAVCVGDLDGDLVVGAADLAILLGTWGGPGAGDLDGNGIVDALDLAVLLGAWGGCG